MHIIIAAITAIAGLIWALNSLQRSGFDLNSLNPFYWIRRKRWEEKQINPLYSVETPREMAALLMFGVLKQAGDPTAEQKKNLLDLYENELKFGPKESNEMYSLASYLINTDPNYTHKVPQLMAPALQDITEHQLSSTYELVERVATFSNTPNAAQADFLKAISETVEKRKAKSSW